MSSFSGITIAVDVIITNKDRCIPPLRFAEDPWLLLLRTTYLLMCGGCEGVCCYLEVEDREYSKFVV